MNDLSKSLKILVDRYPGTMAELARQAQDILKLLEEETK